MEPDINWQMQVRQVPLRQELGISMPAASADFNSVVPASASKSRPDGSSRTLIALGAVAVVARGAVRAA